MTHTVLLPHTRPFRKLESDNLKIEVLKDNTELLNVALEDMRLKREEEKRKLQERSTQFMPGFKTSTLRSRLRKTSW